uniref:Uncharacterized protein n=1 Tax=Glossina palpalis gambiensis TaxID=67801 RepID=A0A1B0AQ05_9MUSC
MNCDVIALVEGPHNRKRHVLSYRLTTAKKSLNNLRIARASLDESLIKMLLRVKLITSIILDFEYCANATVLIALFYLLYFKVINVMVVYLL